MAERKFSKRALTATYEAEIKRIDIALFPLENELNSDMCTPDWGGWTALVEKVSGLRGERRIMIDLLERCKNA